MKQKRLLLLLALLMTAATGAWAQSATTTYKVDLNDGTQNPATWQGKAGDATDFGNLPLQGVAEGQAVTLKYNGRLKVKGITATIVEPWDGDLSKLTAESTAEYATATDGMTIKGALAEGVNVKVSIAQGATVTLDGVTINGVNDYNSYNWAGINCLGDATIILSGTNTVKGFHMNYPGIHVPQNKTLTIQGSGSLTASSSGNGCGIGGGNAKGINCGNIVIAGGTITANGSDGAAGIGSGIMGSCGNISITGGTINANGGAGAPGIGSGYNGSCGNITITGGTVNANGGEYAAGIGSGSYGSCGTVTITDGVTSVTATKGNNANYSIGAGNNGSCGTVTIGGTKYWENNAAVGDGATYLAQSPYTYLNLATVTEATTVGNGYTVTGALGENVKISIAEGATVTLDGVTINGVNNDSYQWAGINCLGDATIILSGTNTVKGFYEDYPGIHVPVDKTLTIEGSGSLTASSNGYGCGIGGGYHIACGNIVIAGGTITATGGQNGAGIGGGRKGSCGNISITGGTINANGGFTAAGIGSGQGGSCGNISITGGTVTANGGHQAAGIGSGTGGSCGTVTITDGVTSVTATKGNDAPYSIGAGYGNSSCGTVTIGGTVYWQDNAAVGDGATYLAQATIVYPAPALSITSPSVGQVIGSDGKNYAYASLPTGVTAVAKICYVSGSNGLALALDDEKSGSSMNWSTAQTTCAAHTAPFTGGTWKLATKDEWNNMINAAGSDTALRDGFSSVGGTNMEENRYWSSTEDEDNSDLAWLYYFDLGYWNRDSKNSDGYVRACLEF